MIPNIFVSSTIKDLQYLREAIRETILDLAYYPVMSDFGEVGYLNPTTAAASCYRSVEQCQLFILIIGRRYGSLGEDGMSVTHREFKTAQEHSVPSITFIEPQVLTYKEVYDSAPENMMWDAFPHMDHPRRTFQLIEEVGLASTYNAILPFNNVADAKRKLKMQIADFVGTYLQDGTRPFRSEFKDLLAELKTLRNQISHSGRTTVKQREETRQYLQTMRFLLDERNSDYRKFLQGLSGDIDAALPSVMKAKSFEDLMSCLGLTAEIHEDAAFQEYMKDRWQELKITGATYGVFGGYATTRDKRVLITPSQIEKFDGTQKSLAAKLDSDKVAR
jgi:hypothetical protein